MELMPASRAIHYLFLTPLLRGTMLFMALRCSLGVAQTSILPGVRASSTKTTAFGTITGHVICADTRLPARFAKVVLQPVVARNQTKGAEQTITAVPVAETALDGSFTISHLRSGDYYVTAEKAGYLSPLGQLSREDLDHPTEDKVKTMARLLTPASVVGNRITTANVQIYKGASISGRVRFDDGTADGAAALSLFRKDDSGKWKPFALQPLAGMFSAITADDQGSFRISGLPSGEYLVATKLTATAYGTNEAMDGYSTTPLESLLIFSGHATRERDAKVNKVSEGEDLGGVDIEVPLSTLHSITGHLVEEGSGRVVNAGTVTLKYSDDGTTVISTKVESDDGGFHLGFVPEGEYAISVSNAHDVTRADAAADPLRAGDQPETIVRSFIDSSQKLILTSDLPDLLVRAGALVEKASPSGR